MRTYTHGYTYTLYTYTRRTCRPPPRRKLPFAVNLIRVLPPPSPQCPSYERVTDARWPFRLCTHNFIPPGQHAVVWRRIRRRRVGWRTTFLCTWSFALRLHFRQRELFKRHFPPPPSQNRDDICACVQHFCTVPGIHNRLLYVPHILISQNFSQYHMIFQNYKYFTYFYFLLHY